MATSHGIVLVEGAWKKLTIEASLVPGQGLLRFDGPAGQEIKSAILAAVNAITLFSSHEEFERRLHAKDIQVSVEVEGCDVPLVGESYGLALTMSVLAAAAHRPLPSDMVFCASIGPAGEAIPVGKIKEKRRAATHMGFERIMLAASQIDMSNSDIIQCPVRNIQEAYSVTYY